MNVEERASLHVLWEQRLCIPIIKHEVTVVKTKYPYSNYHIYQYKPVDHVLLLLTGEKKKKGSGVCVGGILLSHLCQLPLPFSYKKSSS